MVILEILVLGLLLRVPTGEVQVALAQAKVAEEDAPGDRAATPSTPAETVVDKEGLAGMSGEDEIGRMVVAGKEDVVTDRERSVGGVIVQGSVVAAIESQNANGNTILAVLNLELIQRVQRHRPT
mmetsp:Transcript_10135/g.16614  ORF Transcript_10135/g.16614 Transcript_10135/m.16614 type:complete len:125 (+) Transcript_10135:157-531(+)